MDKAITDLQAAVNHPDNRLQLGWAFNLSPGGGTVYGVTVMGPRKQKRSPFLVAHDPHPNTYAGVLRSLADLLEAT
jgi:hypothetical protein